MIQWTSQEATSEFNSWHSNQKIEDNVIAIQHGSMVFIAIKPFDHPVHLLVIEGNKEWLDNFKPTLNVERMPNLKDFCRIGKAFWPEDDSFQRLWELLGTHRVKDE